MTDFLKIAKSIAVHFAHNALTASKRLMKEAMVLICDSTGRSEFWDKFHLL